MESIPTGKKTKTVCSYIRFSSPQQMQGDSLRRQTEASETYAAEHGLHLDHSLNLRDLGISAYRGKNATEGALAGFLQAIQTGRVSVGSILLVESLDLLSRDHISYALAQFLSIINVGVTLVTLMDGMLYSREKINENPGSLMMSIVIMTRAHKESASKSNRIGKAWEKKRKLAYENKTPEGKQTAAGAAERFVAGLGPDGLSLGVGGQDQIQAIGQGAIGPGVSRFTFSTESVEGGEVDGPGNHAVIAHGPVIF